MIKAIGAIGPEFRGAEYPEFDPLKINESRIPDCMRFKEYEYVDCGSVDHLRLVWTTQEPYTDEERESFLLEVRRALKENGCTGQLDVEVEDRDEICEAVTTAIHV